MSKCHNSNVFFAVNVKYARNFLQAGYFSFLFVGKQWSKQQEHILNNIVLFITKFCAWYMDFIRFQGKIYSKVSKHRNEPFSVDQMMCKFLKKILKLCTENDSLP